MMYIYSMSEYLTDEQIKNQLRAKKLRSKRNRRILIICLALILAVVDGYFIGKVIGNKRYTAEVSEPVVVAEDMPIINVAMPEIGNKGGDKFWSWYGFGSHVAWCACYVSWCENKADYLKNGWGPKFADCGTGVAWFKNRGQWINSDGTPAAGDFIFFDWEQDGIIDHVGIVTGVVKDQVYAIEGNSSDRCRQKRYYIGDSVIYGYGHPEVA